MREGLLRDKSIDEESMPEASVDKSVVNWLMHVISGPNPEGGDPSHPATEEAQTAIHPEAAVETTSHAVAAEEMPHVADAVVVEPEKSMSASSFTAEDLCGAPIVPIVPVAHSVLDEITADDLCFVPKDQRPQAGATAEAMQPVGPQLVQSPKNEAAPEEILHGAVDATHAEAGIGGEAQWWTTGPVPVEPPEPEVDIARHSAMETAAPPVVEWQPSVIEPAGPELVEPKAAETPAEANATAEAGHAEAHEIEPETANAEASVPEVVTGETAPATQSVEAGTAEAHAIKSEDVAKEEEKAHEVVAEEAPAEVTSTFFQHYEAQMEEPRTVEQAHPSVGPAQPQTVADGTFRVEEPAAYAEPAIYEEMEEAESPEVDEAGSEEHFAMPMHGLDPEFLKEIEEKPERWNAAWKAMMRLGSVMPWLSRFSPMFEGGEQSALSKEVRHEVAGLRLLQYEIKTTIQDHSLQLKRLEDELTKVRESVESDSTDSATVMEGIKSTSRLVRTVGIGVGALLVVLILLVAIMMAHGK